ncbi:MAG: Rrf2 family transcriptional regulator [Gammaproteobacteria bacterium]|nr:MAG: Rrf2 family transcriptional regulator [Gammaproteobacteria bacterium]
MKLSTKARHAITAMMDLAINDNYKPVTLADISQCQGISLSYLEQLFAKLRKSGLVIGVRGPGGGYRLSRSPSEISVAQVISSIDENVQPQQEHTELSVQFDDRCITHHIWDELSTKIYNYLDGVSLGEFTQKPEYQALRQQATGGNRSHMFPKRTAA